MRRQQLTEAQMLFSVTEHFMKTTRHASFYLASGPETGPLIIFVHGWPELSQTKSPTFAGR
jgi:pimeloyl-ACP methyl ester carboxylesterase